MEGENLKLQDINSKLSQSEKKSWELQVVNSKWQDICLKLQEIKYILEGTVIVGAP